MESIYRKIGLYLIPSILILTTACKSNEEKAVSFSTGFTASLQPGDIILRMGRGFSSVYFRNLSITEKRFSHVGIICRSADSLCVVHALANGQTPAGIVELTSISSFVEESRFGAVYRYPFQLPVRKQIANFALAAARDSLSFDWQFDLDTPEKVYCTELVFQAVNAAVDSIYLKPHLETSRKQYITLDDTYLRPIPLEQVAWFTVH